MLVVDTSVAARWVIGTDDPVLSNESAIALTLLSRRLVAPDLLAAEFANVMWKKVRAREIGAKQAREAIAILPEIIDLIPIAELARRAMDISFDLDHPAYDCFFLASAEMLETVLVSADKRLLNRCGGTPYAQWIVGLTDRNDWRE
ncbi:type II toxin-antitoxin system VapC family toxin [Sphingobium sp.]|uniref:type II toxin-antitoxin system VapC family toxin n=1 Tax=Sphingobium sp. TaxID=1912891 RepID=UPI002621078A|nr:type II toxin-antitoxin system VapC family toxin [Sphingobium sp.]